jgi:hypothetical protein
MTILLLTKNCRVELFEYQIDLSSRPERTRISCHAALDMTTCAPFRKERRMKFAEATNLNRKSGVAQWRDLRLIALFSAGPKQAV